MGWGNPPPRSFLKLKAAAEYAEWGNLVEKHTIYCPFKPSPLRRKKMIEPIDYESMCFDHMFVPTTQNMMLIANKLNEVIDYLNHIEERMERARGRLAKCSGENQK